jgi:hypothetical protein
MTAMAAYTSHADARAQLMQHWNNISSASLMAGMDILGIDARAMSRAEMEARMLDLVERGIWTWDGIAYLFIE